MQNNTNLINRLLCCLNPRFRLPCNHYVCGCNLAIFSSFAQIENCLTSATNNCKTLISSNKKCLRESKNKIDSAENLNENIK